MNIKKIELAFQHILSFVMLTIWCCGALTCQHGDGIVLADTRYGDCLHYFELDKNDPYEILHYFKLLWAPTTCS